MLAYLWRRYLMRKTRGELHFLITSHWTSYVTKMRFIVLKIIPTSTIPDAQTRSSDGRSGLMLFPSQRICQALHKTEVSSTRGSELYFWCAFCSSAVLATRWTQSLVAPSKCTFDHFVHEDYVCNFLLDNLVICSGTKPDVNNFARGPEPTTLTRLFHTCNGRRQPLCLTKECAQG